MQLPQSPQTPEQFVALEAQKRLEIKAASMTEKEVISALKRHLKRMQQRGASLLSSAVIARTVEILESQKLLIEAHKCL